ncbi:MULTISPECIES: hypothetical protein [Dyella]|uniref:PNPLA domain-containing protein n=2 Tax=Dyella TaxID=231454 RepID=A0A4V2NLE9_9GAMM|nr:MULTISPECIES: hypothetical protein [Dyella]TBR35858.1 hypothetical protein EYV96_17860 [Dyella terrae]TCI08594.1 hypothetical protein EZM97_28695 [Dyella soli]
MATDSDAPATFTARFGAALNGIGWSIALVIDNLKPLRVTLLVLIFGTFIATSVDQVTELFLIALWVDDSPWRFLALIATSTIAGLALWYAARNAYRLDYPRWPALQDPRGAWLRDWLPRVIGAAVPALVVIAYFVALHKLPNTHCDEATDCTRRASRAIWLVVESAALITFFIARRHVLNAMPAARRGHRVAPRPSLETRVLQLRHLGRPALAVYAMTIALNLAATALIASKPELLDGVGPLAILLISASFLCLSGGFLCMIADQRGFPLLTLLALVSGLLHAAHLNDNHLVRQYPSMSTHDAPVAAPVSARPTFDSYANTWLTQRCAGRRICPVVVVSAEGGGIRGAAWTAMVLARLTSMVDARHPVPGEPLLPRYLFAGSGVSGGSLGLATYVALLGQRPGAMETRADAMLGGDFLAPMLANLFFVDFTQRWLPGAWFDDRSRALTRAWEQAARRQGIDAFNRPFSDLYRLPTGAVDISRPALFLNSTTVAEGMRFIQHPFYPLTAKEPEPWTAGYDGSDWLDPRTPLSEVVLNSARFTYVSPAGTLLPTDTHRALTPARLQLVDGGYYENSGTTTLLEVMDRLRTLATQRQQTLRFIVIHISNDPSLDDFVHQHDRDNLSAYSVYCSPNPAEAASPSGEVTAPAKALLKTRSARGAYARTQLLQSLDLNREQPDQGDMLWHFRLCEGHYPIPLGWTISTPVFDELKRQLNAYPLDAMATTLDQQLSDDSR